MAFTFFKRLKYSASLLLLVLVHVICSYNFLAWWYAPMGTIAILLISRSVWKARYLERTGFDVSPRGIIFVAVVLWIVLIFSSVLSREIAQNYLIQINLGQPFRYLHGLFYTLNEEIVLGAMLVLSCVRKLRVHPLAIAAGLALIFSGVHFVFYRWIFYDRGTLHATTLATLFLIGLTRNLLIVKFQHIGYAWALHFGWIAIMLDSNHFYPQTGTLVTELERFNLYLGSPELLFTSVVLASLSLLLLRQPVGCSWLD